MPTGYQHVYVPTLQLDPTFASPGAARKWIATHLRGFPRGVVETATLLISEVVTNAVLHGGTQIFVSLDATANPIRVEVADANPGFSWLNERPGPDAEIGTGLGVIEVLSSAWGVRRAQVGKVVWFELRCE